MTSTAVAEREPANTAITPMEMLNNAVQSGASIDTLEKLMNLQERWEKNQARKAFDQAIAAAKAEIPVIQKNAKGHNDKRYANFAAIASVVDPIISKHGLSYRFRTQQDDRIHVTCILSHEAGHSEETTLSGPSDTSGSKNAIQAIGSTLQYLQRYSLNQMLGLATGEDDDGRKAGGDEMVSEDQVAELRALIMDVDADLPKLLAYLKVERLEDIFADKFETVKRVIEQKRAKP